MCQYTTKSQFDNLNKMPKVLAQGKAIQAVGARWLVLGHGGAFVTPNTCLEQVFTRLLDWYRANSGKFGLCRDNCGANLRTTLQQNGIDLYNGGAKVLNCCLIGNCSTCAVKVESGVSAAIWWDKTRQMQHFPIFLQQTCV